MKTVKLIPGELHGEKIILILFDPNPVIHNPVLGLQGIKRRPLDGNLYLKYSATSVGVLFHHLRKINCYVDYSEFPPKPFEAPIKEKRLSLPPTDPFHHEELIRFRRWLEEKRLSPHTVNTYVEVTRFFMRYSINLKHKTLLALIYSGGLRIGEAVNLKVNDIDRHRMLIHIKGGKGKKDRYTLLSQSFLTLFHEYYKHFKPKVYLFEGQNSKTVSYTHLTLPTIYSV